MKINANAFVITARCMVLLLVIGLYPGAGCLAADQVSKIRSIPYSQLRERPANVRAVDHFNIVGTLNLIDSGRVIIGDTEINLARGVDTSGVSQYDEVGAHLNQQGEVVAIELVSDTPH